MVSVPSVGVIGKSALEVGQFLRRNFWMISGGPSSPGPFGLLLNKGVLCKANLGLTNDETGP